MDKAPNGEGELLYNDPLVRYIETLRPEETLHRPSGYEIAGIVRCENEHCRKPAVDELLVPTLTKDGDTKRLCKSCRIRVHVKLAFLGMSHLVTYCADCGTRIHPLRVICKSCEKERQSYEQTDESDQRQDR